MCSKSLKEMNKNRIRSFNFDFHRIALTGTLLLYFGTRAYLFSSDEGSCYIFSARNNCCEFLASYGDTFQSAIKSSWKSIFNWVVNFFPLFCYILEYFMARIQFVGIRQCYSQKKDVHSFLLDVITEAIF